MPVSFQIAIKKTGSKDKKEVITYQCQCGYIVTSGHEELLFSHLKIHSEARISTPEMEKFFKSR